MLWVPAWGHRVISWVCILMMNFVHTLVVAPWRFPPRDHHEEMHSSYPSDRICTSWPQQLQVPIKWNPSFLLEKRFHHSPTHELAKNIWKLASFCICWFVYLLPSWSCRPICIWKASCLKEVAPDPKSGSRGELYSSCIAASQRGFPIASA